MSDTKDQERQSENSVADRRRYARFQLLEYAMVYEGENEEPTRSVVVDISLGGLQTRSRKAFEVGQKCLLVVGRGSGRPMTVHAEVRYCAPVADSALFSIGFRFKPESTHERVELVDYVHGIFRSQGETLIV